MTDGHPMCAAGEHDYCRVIDGRTIPAPVVCSRCGQPISSVTIDRLVAEVKRDKDQGNPHYYNRVHNRHNRS